MAERVEKTRFDEVVEASRTQSKGERSLPPGVRRLPRGTCRHCGKRQTSFAVMLALRPLDKRRRPASGGYATMRSWSLCEECAATVFNALDGSMRRMKGTEG